MHDGDCGIIPGSRCQQSVQDKRVLPNGLFRVSTLPVRDEPARALTHRMKAGRDTQFQCRTCGLLETEILWGCD